jgi:threonine aldolase
MRALDEANSDHAVAYGDDRWTERALALFRDTFGDDIDVYLVFGGTGANVLAVSSLVQSYHGIICSSFSHLYMDECGSPETFTGCKLIPIDSPDAKLSAGSVGSQLLRIGDEHAVQPNVISITQANEYGLLYTSDEIRELSTLAHRKGLYVHMDGARLANAAASQELGLRESSRDLGVDVLSFGGTKNGLMFGEAVVFFDKQLSRDTRFHRKKLTQLASKMRYISAQFEAYLSNELWLQNAVHANIMAKLLAESIQEIPGIALSRAVQTNMVFARIDPAMLEALQKEFFFYVINPETNECRWVTSFDTTQEDVESFVQCMKKLSVG